MHVPFDDAAADWQAQAHALARWTRDHLLNRGDRWLAYLPVRKRQPGRDAEPVAGQLSESIVASHYAATKPHQLIGLHCRSASDTARWLAISLDREGADDPVTPGTYFQAALTWFDRLADLGFAPVLEDVDGVGSYRLLVLLDAPVPAEELAGFGARLVADYGHQDLIRPPSLLPAPADSVEFGGGDWLRLPGRHPLRRHYSRFWTSEGWLDGAAAIDTLCRTTPAPSVLLKTRGRTVGRMRGPALPTSGEQPTPAPEPPAGRADPVEAPEPATRAPKSTPAPPAVIERAAAPATGPAVAVTHAPVAPAVAAPVAPPAAPEPARPAAALDLDEATRDTITTLARRTGLPEAEVIRRAVAWLDEQDEAVQALVLRRHDP